MHTHPLWRPFETTSAEQMVAARVRPDSWQPTPIEVVAPDPAWPGWYVVIRDRVRPSWRQPASC